MSKVAMSKVKFVELLQGPNLRSEPVFVRLDAIMWIEEYPLEGMTKRRQVQGSKLRLAITRSEPVDDVDPNLAYSSLLPAELVKRLKLYGVNVTVRLRA